MDQGINQATGFLGALFDISFTQFVTTRLIRVLYVLAMIAAGLFCLLLLIGAFNSSTGFGIIMLIVGCPVIFLLAVVWARVSLELTIVFFRIAEHTSEIAEQGRHTPPAALTPATFPTQPLPATPPVSAWEQ